MNKTHIQIINEFKKVIPPLRASLYKGQAGKIVVVGGSAEYTGAPYYSAMAALRCVTPN
jgi:ATP-dependent NAD(P)H-hydrate dehydratase